MPTKKRNVSLATAAWISTLCRALHFGAHRSARLQCRELRRPAAPLPACRVAFSSNRGGVANYF